MSRLRTLKPSFFTHEKLADLSPLHRLLFQGLWCHADREGRLEDRPRYLKTVILPYDECELDRMLSDLAASGFIVRYEVGGRHYIAIPKFSRHQKPHTHECASEIPAPNHTNILNVSAKHDLGSAQALPKHDQSRAEPGGLLSLDNGLGDCLGAGGPPNHADPSTQPTEIFRLAEIAPQKAAELSPFQAATKRLCEAFERETGVKYKHGGAKDASAIKSLLNLAKDEEIEARWVSGLRNTSFPKISSLAQLAQHWNSLAPKAKPKDDGFTQYNPKAAQ